MRKLLYLFTVLTGFASFASCTKESVKADGSASLSIVNALVDTGYRSFQITSKELTGLPQTSNWSFTPQSMLQIGFLSGKENFYLYTVQNDKLVTGPPLLDLDVELPNGFIGSLFIAGTLKRPDTLLIKDQPLYFPPADSSMGLRFVNLMQGGLPISVNIKGRGNGTEVGHLPFKAITEFKRYAANTAADNYVFEFRNNGTGVLLASFTINNPGTASPHLWRYRNFTLVLCGVPGSALTPPSAFIVKNH